MTRRAEFFSLFHRKILGVSDPELVNEEPEPDIFLIAAKRFPDNPDRAMRLVFEDAPNSVKAAFNAGTQVVKSSTKYKHIIY